MNVLFLHKPFFFALASIPALLLIYLLFRLAKPVVVSTLLLWSGRTSGAPRGWSLRKIPLPPTFWVEVLILFFLILAAVGPRIPRETRATAILILDDSYSMRANDDRFPSARIAGEREIREIRAERPNLRLTCILAGAEPVNLGTLNQANLKSILSRWRCDSSTADIPAALMLGRKLYGKGRLFVITDHPPEHAKLPPRNVKWFASGHPTPNTAVVDILRGRSRGKEKMPVFIANFTREQTELKVELQTVGNSKKQWRKLKIPPKTTVKTDFRIPNAAEEVEISIPNDALPFDDTLSVLPETQPHLRVALQITDRELRGLVEKALKLQNVDLTPPSEAELIITEHNSAKFADVPRVVFPTTKGSIATVAGPYTVDGSHQLVNGLSLKNTIWTFHRSLSLSGYPLALAGDEPLITFDAPRGTPVVTVNFIPKGSTLQRTANWPIFFCNLIDWAVGRRPGLERRNFKSGEKVVFTPPEGTESLLLTNPYGQKIKLTAASRRMILPSVHPGKYSLTAGGRNFEYIVRTVNPNESDLSKLGSGEFAGEMDAETLNKEFADISWAAIIAALALLLLHGLMIAGKKKKPAATERLVKKTNRQDRQKSTIKLAPNFSS